MAEEFFDKAHDRLPFRLTVEDTYGYIFDKYKDYYNIGRLLPEYDDGYFKVCKKLKGTKYEKEVRELLHIQINEFFSKCQKEKPGIDPVLRVPNHPPIRMLNYLEVLDYLNS